MALVCPDYSLIANEVETFAHVYNVNKIENF
jgi:hypothetical protein